MSESAAKQGAERDRPTPVTGDLPFIGLALVASVAGTGVFTLALRPEPDWTLVLGAHAAVVAMCALFTLFGIPKYIPPETLPGIEPPPDPRRAQRIWSVFLTVTTAGLAGAGAVCTLTGYLAWRYHAMRSRPFDEWYAELFPEESLSLDERIYDELLLTASQRENPSRVTPFADVMNYGTKTDKELAINMMRRYFEAPFAPILRRGLDDSNNSVRIQAATAITHLETRFADRAVELEERVDETPTPQNLFDHAWHLDRFAFSGLLDSDRSAKMRRRALEAMQRYVRVAPDNISAHVAVGRLLLRDDQPTEARDWLASVRDRLGPEPRLDAWLMEAHYGCRDFTALRALATESARERERSDTEHIIGEASRLWSGSASAPVRSVT